jgi:hypothetical protein
MNDERHTAVLPYSQLSSYYREKWVVPLKT